MSVSWTYEPDQSDLWMNHSFIEKMCFDEWDRAIQFDVATSLMNSNDHAKDSSSGCYD